MAIGKINGIPVKLPEVVTKSLDADAFPTFDTAVVLADLNLIIADLEALPVTSTHGLAFLNETLTPGVYTTGAGSTSITGSLTLDGTGVTDAVFVIRAGGGISLVASANIILINTLPENVHFLSNGAFPLGAGATMNGNMICKAGATSLGAGCTVVGRMLTLSGEVSGDSSTLSKPTGVGVTIDYRSCLNVIMFTGLGAVNNAGASVYTGYISTHNGVIGGFGTATGSFTLYLTGITGIDQNNYLPFETAGSVVFANADIVYIFPTAPMDFTGFDATGFADNQKFTIINLGTVDATLKALSPSSTNDNKIAADTDIILKQYQGKDVIRRNGTLNKWLIKGNN